MIFFLNILHFKNNYVNCLSLTVKSPVDVHVKPAGTDEYPNLDRALVKLFSKTGHSPIITAGDLAGRTAVKVFFKN